MGKYNNRVELKGGEVVLFHRTGAKRPIWHMRIHVRGMYDLNGKKFSHIQETTGELDLDEATRVALERYDELRLRVRSKQPAKSVTFNDVFELWWTKREEELRASWAAKGRKGKHMRPRWYVNHSRLYWLPYFGKFKMEEMTQAVVDGYWNWRMTYWADADEKERKKHPVTPAKKTLDMEQSALREVFAWGNAHKLFNFQPIISHPLCRKGIGEQRRPSFDAGELKTLHTYLDRWVRGEGNNDKEPGARINSRHLYQRQLLRLYIKWIEGTGMRTGEVLLLKHGDVKLEMTELYEQRVLKIRVPDETKTGTRTVISNPPVVQVYRELCELTGHTGKDDWLFCDQKGKQSKGFYKTLPNMLEEAGLLEDKKCNRRSAYSFRHVYAQGRLAAIGFNPIAYDLICTNMGTSRNTLEKHYAPKGIINDPDALIAEHGLGKVVVLEGESETEAKLREIERRKRRCF
jgi:integrase